jgi:hypothetical protein
MTKRNRHGNPWWWVFWEAAVFLALLVGIVFVLNVIGSYLER